MLSRKIEEPTSFVYLSQVCQLEDPVGCITFVLDCHGFDPLCDLNVIYIPLTDLGYFA